MCAVPITAELFTPSGPITLAALVGMTYVVATALRSACGWSPRWIGLAVGVALSVLASTTVKPEGSVPWHYACAAVNGFLVYLSAMGGSALVGAAAPRLNAPQADGAVGAVGGPAAEPGFAKHLRAW